MTYDLSDLDLDFRVTWILQLVAERMFLKRNAKFSLVAGDVSDEILVGEIVIHPQESVERLKEQNVVARKPIVFDKLAVDHFSHTPALESLDVAQPNRSRYTRLGQVFVKNPEEVAKSNCDVLQVVCTRCSVALIEADNGTNHLIINRKCLESLLMAKQEFFSKAVGPHQDFHIVEHAKKDLFRRSNQF